MELATSDIVVDTGMASDSVGDILAFGNPIFDADNAREIGRDQGYCVGTNVGEVWECNWMIVLDQGTIAVEGPFYDDLRDSKLALTGGTGTFIDAGGKMTRHARNAAGTEFDFIYSVPDNNTPQKSRLRPSRLHPYILVPQLGTSGNELFHQ